MCRPPDWRSASTDGAVARRTQGRGWTAPSAVPAAANVQRNRLKTKTAGHASGRFGNQERTLCGLRRFALAQPSLDDVRRRLAEIPNQADGGETLQQVIR